MKGGKKCSNKKRSIEERNTVHLSYIVRMQAAGGWVYPPVEAEMAHTTVEVTGFLPISEHLFHRICMLAGGGRIHLAAKQHIDMDIYRKE